MKATPCFTCAGAFAALVLCLNISAVQAQLDPSEGLRVVTEVARESLFKRVPTEKEPAPEWALRMYAGDADFFGIVEAREAFWRHREYEKTIHERNFKHWLMHVEHLVDADGQIQPAHVWARDQWAKKTPEAKLDTEAIWQAIGPMDTYNKASEGGFPVSWQCNVYCFDQSAVNPDICVAGIEAGDLFKTVNRGLTWHPITEGVPGIRTVRAVKIAPSDPNRIYFEANASLYGTTDGGITWSLLHSLGEHATQIAVHPTNPDVVFASAWNGLHRSLDGGSTWSQLFTGTTWDVAFHPTSPAVLYALRYASGLNRCEMHRSDDGGATWTLKDNGYFIPADPGNASADGGRLGVTPADPDRVYVALIGRGKAEDTGWIGMYQSLDRGDSWANLNGQDGAPYDETLHPSVANGNLNGSGIYQGFYDFDLAVSHNDPNTAWVGVTALSATYDGGASWQRIGAYSASTYDIGWIHPDIQDLNVMGDHIWVATDGGLNYSSDELATHESRKSGIYNSTFWGFGHGWNNDLQVGGRYHNGNTGYLSTYGGGHHMRLGGAESPTGYVHPLNGEGRQARFSDITDVVVPAGLGGATSTQANLGLYPNESYVDFRNSEVVVDPRYGDRMVLGNGSALHKTEDGGNAWEPWFDFGAGWTVYEIEQGLNDPGRWYVVARSSNTCKLFRSTNDGGSWGQLTSGLPLNWQSMEIAVNPMDANDIYAMQAGGTSVYRSTSGGTSWTNLTDAMWTGESNRELLALGGRGVALFTNEGVYWFDNESGSWTNASAGIPAFWAPLEGATHYASGTVRIADKGKGIWQAAIPFDLAPLAQPMTSSSEVFCALDTVVFDCHSVLNHAGAAWSWSFDPQPEFLSSSTDRRVEAVFGVGGPVDVTLTVTQSDGSSDTKTVPAMVTVDTQNQCVPDEEVGQALMCGGSPQFGLTHDLQVETNTFTAMAWVKPNGIQPDYTGIVLGGVSNAAGLNFRPNNELAYHWPGGAWWWGSGLTVPANEWSHVALVVSPMSVKVILNGVEAVHNTTTQPVDMGAMWLGSYRAWSSRNMNGLVDEVKLWNRALSLDEVRAQRHLNLTLVQTQEDPDFLGYFQFNEAAPFLVNKRPYSNHGVFSGGAGLVDSGAPVGGGELATINMPSSGEVILPFGSLDVATTNATAGTQLRVHQLTSVPPPSSPDSWASEGGWWIVDAYASTTQADPGSSWSGTWSMHALPSSSPWDVPAQLAGVALQSRGVHSEGTWTSVAMGAQDLNPTALSTESVFGVEGQWIWVDDHCDVDSSAATLCPGEGLEWMGELIDTPGDHWHHEEDALGCDVVELLQVDEAVVPTLSWASSTEAGPAQLEVGDEWMVQAWTFNGAVVPGAEDNVLEVEVDGNYGVVAVHVGSGCLMSYEELFGCPGDINGDLTVGVSDVLAYLSSFGCEVNCGVADLNGDGAANTSDLLMMLSLFGVVCN